MAMRDLMPRRVSRELDPFSSFEDAFSTYVDNFFKYVDDFFSSDLPAELDAGIKVDIKETDKEYIIEADLPGFDKDDIEVEIANDTLTISAKKEDEKEEKGENYIRKERRRGEFARSFGIRGVDHNKIAAEYKNGVLTLTLPKTEEEKKQTKKINIK